MITCLNSTKNVFTNNLNLKIVHQNSVMTATLHIDNESPWRRLGLSPEPHTRLMVRWWRQLVIVDQVSSLVVARDVVRYGCSGDSLAV